MNHLVATSARVLTFDLLDATVREINERRFHGVFVVEADSHQEEWDIRHPDKNRYNYRLSLWLETKRKVEMRPSFDDFAAWMAIVVQVEIATKFNGRCGDEFGDRWLADLTKYQTYRKWVERGFDQLPKGLSAKLERMFLRTLVKKQLATLPKELKAFAR